MTHHDPVPDLVTMTRYMYTGLVCADKASGVGLVRVIQLLMFSRPQATSVSVYVVVNK